MKQGHGGGGLKGYPLPPKFFLKVDPHTRFSVRLMYEGHHSDKKHVDFLI